MKPGVYITVDVECSMGGAWQNPDLRPVPPSRAVWGRYGHRELGLPRIVDVLVRLLLVGGWLPPGKVFFKLIVGSKKEGTKAPKNFQFTSKAHPGQGNFARKDSMKTESSQMRHREIFLPGKWPLNLLGETQKGQMSSLHLPR